MGFYVHFQICWNGGTPDIVSPIAKKYLRAPTTELEHMKMRHSQSFFESVTSGKAYFGGEKGCFWCWGTIGNSVRPEEFLEQVAPFFKELYEHKRFIKHHRIIAFCEPEQSENVYIYQLKWNKEANSLEMDKLTSKGKWYWGQM